MYQLCHNLQCETGYFAPCAWEVFNFCIFDPKFVQTGCNLDIKIRRMTRIIYKRAIECLFQSLSTHLRHFYPQKLP